MTANDPPPLALRPREAALALGVSPRTLWQWTKDGVIPCVRVGTGVRRTVLYPADALRDWLVSAGQAVNPRQPSTGSRQKRGEGDGV